jgi:hypothetical protein
MFNNKYIFYLLLYIYPHELLDATREKGETSQSQTVAEASLKKSFDPVQEITQLNLTHISSTIFF